MLKFHTTKMVSFVLFTVQIPSVTISGISDTELPKEIAQASNVIEDARRIGPTNVRVCTYTIAAVTH